MKANLPANYKKIFSLYDMECIEEIESHMVFIRVESYFEWITAIATGSKADFKVLEYTATYSRNYRCDDALADGAGHMDVWVEMLAFNERKGLYKIGAYISDVMAASAYDDNGKQFMLIRHYSPD